MMTDSIADMLTRIRNASRAGQETVQIPYSKLKESVLKVLVTEGFLSGMQTAGEGTRKMLVVGLKYAGRQIRVLAGLSRISRPGRRVYLGCDELRAVRGGMGVTVLSTSKGIMSDHQARQQHLGGEAVCKVW